MKRKLHIKFRPTLLFGLLLLYFAYFHKLHAQETLRFDGFATLALTHENNGDLEFTRSYLTRQRDGTSLLPDSILGLQLNWLANEKLDVFTQLVVDDQNQHSFDAWLEMGFLRYRMSRKWSLSLGRINTNLYMLSDSKHVGHSFIWARPPMEFYAQSMIVESIDGLSLDYQTDWLNGFLKVKASAGDRSVELGESTRNITLAAKDNRSLSIEWSTLNLTLFASVTRSDVVKENSDDIADLTAGLDSIPPQLWPEAPELARGFGLERQSSNYTSIGLKYENQTLIFQGEFASTNVDWIYSPSSYSGYLSLGFYWKDTIPYAVFSFIRPKDDFNEVTGPRLPPQTPPELERSLEELAIGARSATFASQIEQQSISIGTRWDISSSIALKCQFDHFIVDRGGSASLISSVNDGEMVNNQNQNVLHLSINWIF